MRASCGPALRYILAITVMSMSKTTTRIPAPTTTFIGNPNIKTSPFSNRCECFELYSVQKLDLRLNEFLPTLYVGNASFVALDDNFGALFDRSAVVTACARTTTAATQRKNNFSCAVFADGHA